VALPASTINILTRNYGKTNSYLTFRNVAFELKAGSRKNGLNIRCVRK
jgi:hypothetical protein